MEVLLGFVVGLVLGLTGAGGSVIAVPMIMWSLDWTIREAAPVALIVAAAAALFGTVTAWDVRYVRYRMATLMAGTSLLFAPLGLLLANVLPLPALTLLLSGLLLVIAVRMWWLALREPEESAVPGVPVSRPRSPGERPVCQLCADAGRVIWTRSCALAVAACGAVAGFLAGLLGVGGGFIIVPALRAISELSIHSAIATSLMAVALISTGSVAWALLLGRELPWLIALPFIAGALGGMATGRRLAPRVSGPRLQAGFAWLMIVISIGLAVRTFGVL